jgi:hypothetical protein
MKPNLTKSLAFAILVFAVALAQPVLAEVVNYGTGIHHLVLTCTYPGYETQAYVGAASCPPAVILPPNCSCAWTPYDFPVGNPYPYMRVQTLVPTDGSGNPVNTGNVNVIVDASQAIQCGVTVIPPPDDQTVCGAPYNTVPVDPSTLNPVILQIVQGLDFQKLIGGPAPSFTWFITQPQQ